MLAQYDISKIYNSFGGGISDDDFVGTENSVQDMEGVEVRLNDRYATASEAYIASGLVTSASPMLWIKDTDQGTFRGNSSFTYNYLLNSITGTIGSGITHMESYGYGTSQINYFFGSTSIKKTDYTGLSLQTTISSGYPAGATTAVGWHVTNLLFAKDNKVYYLDTVNDVVNAEYVTFMPGSIIKHIYSYSFDSTIVVAINQGVTYIYEINFTGGNYTIVGKTPALQEECFDAIGEGYNLYWLSSEGVNQYQGGQSQLIKYIPLSQDAKCGWDKGLIFSDGDRVYNLGSRKPGRPTILTSNNATNTIIDISNDKILCQNGTISNVNILSGSTKRINKVYLRPIDGTTYKDKKNDLYIEVGYLFDWGTYINNGTRQEIEIFLQTESMQLINESLEISIGKVTDGDITDSIGNLKYGTLRIGPSEIAKSLSTAGYDSDFNYARISIEIKSGDEYIGNPGFYRKAPKAFDVMINSNISKGR